MSRFSLVLLATLVALACQNDKPITAPPPPPPVRTTHNRPPHAVIGGPYTGVEESMIRISSAGTTDPDGDTLSYRWAADDTVRVKTGPDDVEVGYGYRDVMFLDDGVYLVSVIVTDPSGAADTATTTVAISNVPPEIHNLELATSQVVATPVDLIVRYSDAYLDTHRVITRWGDGTTDSMPSPITWGDTVRHTYGVPGRYAVTITVVDDDGGRDSMQTPNPIVIFDPTAHASVAGYETLDLGTFGGVSAAPADINDRGQVVGVARAIGAQVGDDYGRHGFDHAFLWDNGVLRDLGTLSGDRGSEARKINNDGIIAGSSWWADYATSAGTVWANGDAVRLQPAPPGDEREKAAAVAINSAGDILWVRSGENRSMSDLQRHGEASARELVQAHSVVASGMNDRSQIVGDFSYHCDGVAGDVLIYRGFLWDNGVTRELSPLGYAPFGDRCPSVHVDDIDQSGQSVGFSFGSDGADHFVSWNGNGAVTDLGVAALDTVAGNVISNPKNRRMAINDRGQIAGSAGGQAFFWTGGVARSIGSLGAGHTVVVDLNEDGTVVGMSSTANGEQHVFVWSEARGMIDLGTGPQRLSGAWATGINSRGDVIGISAECVRYPSQADECRTPDQTRATLWRKP